MSESSARDVDLVACAQAGDVDAYAALVQRYQALAVGLAAVVTRDPANAEDVALESILKRPITRLIGSDQREFSCVAGTNYRK